MYQRWRLGSLRAWLAFQRPKPSEGIPMQSAEISSRALRFFEQREHTVVPSASLIADDPTLLLINAGMAPFKRVPHSTTRLRLVDALTGDWLTLLIDAHGSAAHAWLGTHVLCGLTTSEERTHTGRIVPAGCTIHRCKLSPDGTLTLVHPHQLRTVLLGLFVCNAIALGPHEQYPSDVSLAADALEGYPAGVLGLLRGDADTSALEPAVTAHLLHAGTPIGDTARLLTLAIANRGVPHAVLVLGDPEQAPPAATDAIIPTVELDQNPPPALPVITSGNRSVLALITPGRALLAASDIAARPHDAHADIDRMIDQLSTWTSRLTEAHLVEDALRAAITRPTPAIEMWLNTMRTVRAKATHIVFGTLRHIQQLRTHRALGMPTDPRQTLDHLAEQWASTMTALAVKSTSTIFNNLKEAVTAHHHPIRQTPARPCDQCGAPRQRQHRASPVSVDDRTELHCPRCGLTTSHPDTGPAITLRIPSHLHPGRTLTLSTRVDSGQSDKGVLAVQLRPRSASRCAYASHICTAYSGSTVTITLDVPQDAEVELHRVWALFTHRFQLSLALRRIPALPRYHDSEIPPHPACKENT